MESAPSAGTTFRVFLPTDLVMPRLSGRALAQRLVSRHPGLPVLYASGLRCPEKGDGPGEEFFLKPFSRRQLLFRVRQMLDRHQGSNAALPRVDDLEPDA